MAIHFSNKGNIDLDVIRTMGVSVKDTANPIGFFGTGLKYAIATLLRTGHIISLRTNGETIQFRTKPKEIRGQMFNMIMMDDEQLGFTAELGKNWEVWQAYRELYANCLDEGGTISGVHASGDTVFTVEGPEIAEIHAARGKIFLQTEPFLTCDGIEIHRGASDALYYRGVRVHKLPKKAAFTYNFVTPMKLTEDRTLASVYDANYKLATRLPTIEDPDYFRKILRPGLDIYEQDIEFSQSYEQSEEFFHVLKEYRSDANLNDKLRDMLKQKVQGEDYEAFTPSAAEQEMIEEACNMLRPLNCTAKPSDLTFVEFLGTNVYALAANGKMYFSRQTLAQGKDFLAITIYEEWIHNKFGFSDKTLGLQQFLFDKILELIKK